MHPLRADSVPPRHRRVAAAAAAVLAVTALVAGCTGTPTSPASSALAAPSTAPPPSADAPSSSATSPGAPSASSSDAPTAPASLTILQAIKKAHAAQDGDVVGAELDRFGEASAWKVDVRTSRMVTVEVAVQQTDGRILAKTRDDTDDEARTVPDYDPVDAIKAAQKRVEGGEATSVGLDTDGGRRVWEVKIRRAPGELPVDVSYDADSGSFVRQQTDD